MAVVTIVLSIVYGLTVGALHSVRPDRPSQFRHWFTVIGGLLVGVLAIIFLLIPFLQGQL